MEFIDAKSKGICEARETEIHDQIQLFQKVQEAIDEGIEDFEKVG